VCPLSGRFVPMMKRSLLIAGFFLAGAGGASADYVLIKIDLNKRNVPQGGGAGIQGGQAGQVGGGPALPGGAGFMGGQPNSPMMVPDDPNAKWVSSWIEVKNFNKKPVPTPVAMLYSYEHKWSVRPGWLPFTPA